MTKRLDPEIRVLRALVRAMALLDADAIERVLRWAQQRYLRAEPAEKA